MKILATAKERGSANAIAPLVVELRKRGHTITVYATGNAAEAAGFASVGYETLIAEDIDYKKVVGGHDIIVTGTSGFQSPDGFFVRAGRQRHIPVISIFGDTNANYKERLSSQAEELPDAIAVMDETCVQTMKKELPAGLAEEAVKRSRVVGWTAFDHYAKMREEFSSERRIELLTYIGINPENPAYVHFTQSAHPHTAYWAKSDRTFGKKVTEFLYEQGVTQFTFEAASDLRLKLAVKPHPGEEFTRNYTKELTDRHGFTFIPARACNTQQLMLAAYSVTAGRSTCLTEATLLDRNVGGIIPDMGEDWIYPFPALALGAIPYTQKWDDIQTVLKQVTSQDETVVHSLAENRKKFSVDGKASQRLADLIEELGGNKK